MPRCVRLNAPPLIICLNFTILSLAVLLYVVINVIFRLVMRFEMRSDRFYIGDYGLFLFSVLGSPLIYAVLSQFLF